MEVNAFLLLKKIREKHGPHEFGKVAQKLFAIALCRLNFIVKERCSQDVDIEAVKADLKYWFEVKTTDKDAVAIGEKDVRCLEQCRRLHGGITGYAILKLSILSDWIVASSNNIHPGEVAISRFAPQAVQPLQEQIIRIFPAIVRDYGNEIVAVKKSEAQNVTTKFFIKELEKAIVSPRRN